MKTYKIFILPILLLMISACNKDFLNTEPLTSANEENFYKTPEDAYKALVGCYDGLQKVWTDGVALPVATEVFSDNCFGGTGNSDGLGYQMMDEFDKSRSPSDLNLFEKNWELYYQGIYRCNMLLGKMDQINWGTNTALKTTYESETRFLRAYMYFDMVRLWENIPLLTTPSKENIPQANPDSVYTVIAQDLKFAAENLPSVSYTSQPVAEHGRVTRWAAEALLSRVYLFYTGYYNKQDLVGVVTKSQALGYLEDVISNGGFDLLTDFASLWPAASLDSYAGEDNRETVFSIKYTATSDYNGNVDGNYWMVMYGMRDQYSYPYGMGWGVTVNPKLWNAYSSNDTRRSASIISVTNERINYTKQKGQREYTGYYNKKYSPMVNENGVPLPEALYNNTDFQHGQFEDYVSIRYADVLLMAAELGSPKAQDYFNEVRQRAYKDKFVQIPVTHDNIMKERWLEFALEGIRYYDLLRQGLNQAAAEIAENTTVLNGGASATKTITAAKIIETRGFQQVPYTQITLSNGVLKQNQGW